MGDYEPRLGGLVHRLANLVGDGIRLGTGTRIDAFVTITGRVTIGRMVHISTGASILGGSGCEIGDFSGLSPGARVFTATEDVSGDWIMHPTVPAHVRRARSAFVSIGRHCTVGANSVLLPGAFLPDGAVVGALSLVKTELPEWSISAGVPARFIRARSRRALELVRQLEQESST